MDNKIFAILSFLLFSCNDSQSVDSKTEAYNAGSRETHLVIAAPATSNTEQRLWVCKGKEVENGTNPNGYLVSIGVGQSDYAFSKNQSVRNRNIAGSNLTPLGELRISKKISKTCAPTMVTRCMQLDGVEQGVNHRTKRRSIFIHGTPTGNYDSLGRSASHGCVRMNQRDVVKIYDRVKVGTRVYINSKPVKSGTPCGFTGKEDKYKAR